MKGLKTSTALFIFIVVLGITSCKKEAAIRTIDKTIGINCPRLASLTTVKSNVLYTVTTYAGADYTSETLPIEGNIIDGVLCDARFIRPDGIAISPNGIIYIADKIGNVRRIDTKGMVSTFAGKTDGSYFDSGNVDGPGTIAKFWRPTDMILGKDGYLYVVDQFYGHIRKISPSAQVSTLISSLRGFADYKNGPLSEAQFVDEFYSLASGPDNSIYLVESNNLIRKVSPDGIVSTFAGQTPDYGYPIIGYQDGPKENALFGGISNIAFAPDGSLYLCDAENIKLRKITVAGVVESVTDLIEPVEYWTGASMAISNQGIIYLSNSSQIFKVDADGIAQLVAGGRTSEHKDGVGTQARFRGINNMAIYKNYLYLTDGSTVRRMNIE